MIRRAFTKSLEFGNFKKHNTAEPDLRELKPSSSFDFLVHDIHGKGNNWYAKIERAPGYGRGIGASANPAGSVRRN